MKVFAFVLILCFATVSCLSNKDPFTLPSKHIVVSVSSGSVFVKVIGTITRNREITIRSTQPRQDSDIGTTIPQGTRTLEKEIQLSGNGKFEYDLSASEVLTFVAKVVDEADAEIRVDVGGQVEVYRCTKTDIFGKVFSVHN